MKEIKGDHYNVACPHCGKNNNYVTDGVKVVEIHRIYYFKKPCVYCKEVIYYAARYEIKVVASDEDPRNP